MSLSLRITSRLAGSEPAWFERLERHAGRHRAIADDRDHAAIFTELRGRDGHAERGADRSARMTDAEGVVLALGATGKGREAAALLDGVQLVAPAGQHLVRIGLVAHVPDDAVVRGVEDIMQSDRQLDRAEPGGEMSAPRAHALDEELAQLLCQRSKFSSRQLAQICRRVDGARAADMTETAWARSVA